MSINRPNSTADLRAMAARMGEGTPEGTALRVAATRIEDLTTERNRALSEAKQLHRRNLKLERKLNAARKALKAGPHG